MERANQFQKKTVSVAFGAGDATKELVAAPGANKFISVTACHVFISTAAAQTFDIESGDGAVELMKFPASQAGNHKIESPAGFDLPVNTNLRYQPAGAGPAGVVLVEYFIDGVY